MATRQQTTRQQKMYVQFSKRCVAGVLICVNVIIAYAVVAMSIDNDYTTLSELMKYYLSFAGVVFIAYSGNSAIEKAFIYYCKSKGAEPKNPDNG